MIDVLRNRTFRLLFLAQVIALVGTGLATVAIGLLAYNLAGADAGAVLGTALAIKMIAYVVLAPIAPVFTELLPRRAVLIALDIVRAAVVVLFPFVSEVWQVYVLIFLLQSASAAYTPVFQATIPDVLPDEKQYTRALSLSRLAYDLENIASPLLAAAVLTVVTFDILFWGTIAGFLAAAAFVVGTSLPDPIRDHSQGGLERTTKGLLIYFKTPRLRGLIGLSLAVAGGASMVLVNTVVLVQSVFKMGDAATALALAAYGAGSMAAAVSLPKILDRIQDREAMIVGASLIAICTLLGSIVPNYGMMLGLWFAIGIGYGATITPMGRIVRRSANPENRMAVFAAQFSLSHACWLLAYPLSGLLGSFLGLPATFCVMSGVSGLGLIAAVFLWPSHDPDSLEHEHFDLPLDDPHVSGAIRVSGGYRHKHHFVIDRLHPAWPRAG